MTGEGVMPTQPDMVPDYRKGALLCGEIQALISVMRQNAKWALVPGYGYGEDDVPEDPLLEDFKSLRRKVWTWKDWSTRDPSTYIFPFLEVIRSVETSGPITGMALVTIYRVLSQGFFGMECTGAAEAMHSIVEAVTHCRFEATDPDADEVVLSRILQALIASLKCPAGPLLSDDDVCSVVQACFRIGHQSGKEGELLQQLARQTMHEMVRVIFHRLPHMSPITTDMLPSPLKAAPPSSADDPSLQTSAEGSTANGAGSDRAAASGEVNESLDQVGMPYGLPSVLEVFTFLISLVGAEDGRDAEDLCVFGLALINTAMEEGGEAFAMHPALLALVRDDLMRAMLQAGTSMSLSVLSYLCSLFLNLYLALRVHLKFQLETFGRGVIIPLGDGRQVAYDQQRVALESMVDLCRQPTFMCDMYINYDCNLQHSNFFEDICSLLSKNAFPVNCPLSAVHLLSLEGLLAVVHIVANRCQVASGAAALPEPEDITEYRDFWSDSPPLHAEVFDRSMWLRRRKFLKKRVAAGVEHFNRDGKKGFQYLSSINLLPSPPSAQAIAMFLRFAQGLDKQMVGEYLGDAKDLNIEVLKEYTNSFHFEGMTLDSALRLFLEGYLLPGEAQKISRILEHFADQYFQGNGQATGGVLADADAAYVLSYSIIMLNTDLHNKQVKNKMTLQQFISNNRGTNGGKDWPKEVLTDIYNSIAGNEIKMKSDGGEVSSGRLQDVARRSNTGDEGTLLTEDPSCTLHDPDLFTIIWGPSIAAMSVVFDHTDDEQVLREVLDGFLDVAKIAAAQRQVDVMDNLMSSLCKFTTLLNPAASRPAVAFGEDTKARMAAVTVFTIANKYGDQLRAAWRNILDCILRLHKLGLLPSQVTEQEDSILDESQRAPVRPAAQERKPASTSILRGLSNQFSQLLSLDTDDSQDEPSEREREAEARTLRCIEACRIDEIFADSKFLEGESLLHLARALIWAAGSPSDTARPGGSALVPSEDEDTAMFCLEQVVSITIRNRDRMLLLWPLIYEHLSQIVQGATAPGPLVERAVFSLVRICQRLLPYKEDIADELLSSLQLLFKLDSRVAEALLERITSEVLLLLKGSVTYIRSATGWRIVCRLLSAAACHQDASEVGFEALSLVMAENSHVSAANFLPCLEASLAFVQSRVGGSERSVRSLDLLAGTSGALTSWSTQLRAQGQSSEELITLWARLLHSLRAICVEPRADVRNHALVAMQRVVLAAEKLEVPGVQWAMTLEEVLLPLLGELTAAVAKRSADMPQAERTLRMAVATLSKAFLQSLPTLRMLPVFPQLWSAVLGHLEKGMKASKSEELAEAIPESLKNILMVMVSLGVLTPSNSDLWAHTWKVAAAISPALQPDAITPSAPPPAPPAETAQ